MSLCDIVSRVCLVENADDAHILSTPCSMQIHTECSARLKKRETIAAHFATRAATVDESDTVSILYDLGVSGWSNPSRVLRNTPADLFTGGSIPSDIIWFVANREARQALLNTNCDPVNRSSNENTRHKLYEAFDNIWHLANHPNNSAMDPAELIETVRTIQREVISISPHVY